MPARQSSRPERLSLRESSRTPAAPRRALMLAGAGSLLALLAGCDTVSLDTPAPVQVLHAASVPMPMPAPRPQPVPAPAPAPEPAAQAQGLQPLPEGMQMQPLAPASTPSLPASSPSLPPSSSAVPGASGPASFGSAPAVPAVPPASLPAAPTPAGAVRFVCNDGSSFLATFGDVSVTMRTAFGDLRLEQTLAADGARYTDGQVQVWFKGRQATVTRPADPSYEVLCLEQR